MNCEQSRKLIPLAVLGELSKEDATILQMHVNDCAECSAYRAEYEHAIHATTAHIRRVSDSSSSDGMSASVIREIKRRKRTTTILYRIVPVAAALLIAVGSLLFMAPWPEINTAVVNEEQIESYIATYYLSVYDLAEVAVNDDFETEYDTADQYLFGLNIHDISANDMIGMLDEDELEIVLASF